MLANISLLHLVLALVVSSGIFVFVLSLLLSTKEEKLKIQTEFEEIPSYPAETPEEEKSDLTKEAVESVIVPIIGKEIDELSKKLDEQIEEIRQFEGGINRLTAASGTESTLATTITEKIDDLSEKLKENAEAMKGIETANLERVTKYESDLLQKIDELSKKLDEQIEGIRQFEGGINRLTAASETEGMLVTAITEKIDEWDKKLENKTEAMKGIETANLERVKKYESNLTKLTGTVERIESLLNRLEISRMSGGDREAITKLAEKITLLEEKMSGLISEETKINEVKDRLNEVVTILKTLGS